LQSDALYEFLLGNSPLLVLFLVGDVIDEEVLRGGVVHWMQKTTNGKNSDPDLSLNKKAQKSEMKYHKNRE